MVIASRYFSKRLAALYACIIMLFAVLMRFVLIYHNWPPTNADEATMDLEAWHVAYRGEHPIFFYGQYFMGTIQAYLGAIMIRFFGTSAFSVRLGTLLIFALYILCIYYLVSLLYSRPFALLCMFILSLGSERMVTIPLLANGGYAETMLFSAVIFLLASWLALTAQAPEPYSRRQGQLRTAVYALLGCVIGLGIWSDPLILSAVLTAGLFLWISCRYELWSWRGIALCGGLLLGASPLLIYNLSAPLLENSLYVLIGVVISGHVRVVPLLQQLAQVVFISLPLATGIPSVSAATTCGNTEPYQYALTHLSDLFPTSNPALCFAYRGAWSLMAIALWSIALACILVALRRQGIRWKNVFFNNLSDIPAPKRYDLVRLYARLMLLESALLWFVLFATSYPAANTPRGSSRYLICLLLAAPAVLWPLWQGVRATPRWQQRQARLQQLLRSLSTLTFAVIIAAYIFATLQIFLNLPAAQSVYNQHQALIQVLLEQGATRIYSDYDTCNILIFQSHEQIMCSVLDDQLQPGLNRYALYPAQVQLAPHPAYVFPVNSAPLKALQAKTASNPCYHSIVLDAYAEYHYIC